MRENWKHISGGFYTVRTQAGFRQAVRHFAGAMDGEYEIKGFPNEYPALVSLSIGYSGNEWIRVQSLPFHGVLQAISESDA
jgi:hypothetical protein